MNINGFKATVQNIARPTLFDVMISGPAVQTMDMELLQFTCKAASLPASTFGKIEVPFYGRKVNMPGDRLFQEWQTTVILDSDFTIYKQLMNWHQKMSDAAGNVSLTANVNAFKCDAIIKSYDTAGNPGITGQLTGCWPGEIQQLDLAWDQNDSTLDLIVSWNFDYWTVIA
jgi:hypothetical protein